MDTTSQVTASVEYEEMLHQQKLLDEYQHLGSQYPQVSDMVQIGLPLLVLGLLHQFAQLDAATLMLLQWGGVAYVLVYTIVLAERKKTNRRIDLLFRLMQHQLTARPKNAAESQIPSAKAQASQAAVGD